MASQALHDHNRFFLFFFQCRRSILAFRNTACRQRLPRRCNIFLRHHGKNSTSKTCVVRISFKVEALWFGCYGVIIWFLSGKMRASAFCFSAWATFFALFVCAIFSVRFTQINYYHVTKELCAWLITRYTFHAHCCVVYQRAIAQDADVFWEDQNFIKFPSKIVRFCHFLWKVIRQPHYFISLFCSI